MPLVATTIRWDEAAYEMVREEARSAGVPVAQFVREAAMIRAAMRAARRDAPGDALDYQKIAELVEERSRA